jgi:hypothetical protein
MPQAIERRRDHEQMHRMSVVRHDIVESTKADPSRIAQRQPEAAVRCGHGCVEWLVDVPRIVGG